MSSERLRSGLLALVLLALALPVTAAPAGSAAPEVTLETLSGDTVNLSQYRGKLVMVNFWAPWCPPCRQEMPDLQAFHQKYDDTVVLGLAVEYRSRENVVNMVDMMSVTYPVALVDREMARKFGDFRGLPTTFYITPDGRLYGQHAGILSADLMETYRKEILAETGS